MVVQPLKLKAPHQGAFFIPYMFLLKRCYADLTAAIRSAARLCNAYAGLFFLPPPKFSRIIPVSSVVFLFDNKQAVYKSTIKTAPFVDTSQEKTMKYIIVGGVAGGATAAARLRRLDESAEIIMFERGNDVSFANCGLPYYVGDVITSRNKLLVQTANSIRNRFNIMVRPNSEVIAVDTNSQTVTVKANGRTYQETYNALLLAPGAKPIIPKLEGTQSSKIVTLRNMDDVDKLKFYADNATYKRAIIVGGGFIGIETAENLKRRGLDVTLIEAAPHILAPFDDDMVKSIEKTMKFNGIQLILNTQAQGFEENGDTISVTLSDGSTHAADFIVLAIGVRPDTDFLRDSQIKLNARGYILVDDELRTNIPNVYAAGDAIELFNQRDMRPMTLPLAGPANRQGRCAADNMTGMHKKLKGLNGSAILKVFDLTAATTGANARTLKRDHIPYHTVICHPLHHAGYYPGATQMTLKLLFAPDGTILGAQSIGQEGVDKRIDVIAAMMQQKANVRDLIDLELCYAPPFSSAKDPVNMVGYMAENVLDGLSFPIDYDELNQALEKGARLIDVRTPGEFLQGHLPGAENMPLDEIRHRLNALDKTIPIIVYCQVGLRGYYAERILRSLGYQAHNLNGGYRFAALQS